MDYFEYAKKLVRNHAQEKGNVTCIRCQELVTYDQVAKGYADYIQKMRAGKRTICLVHLDCLGIRNAEP